MKKFVTDKEDEYLEIPSFLRNQKEDHDKKKSRDKKKNRSIGRKIVDKIKKIKLPKLKKGRKVRRTRNLVTGKMNKTQG